MSESEAPSQKVEVEEEEPLIITAKDPKKVEQGKRLAAISKEAKEKKMRARIKEEDFSYLPWIGYGVAVFSTLGLCYMTMTSGNSEPELQKVHIVREPKPKKFENF